jgi:hypothetical protein
MSVADRVRSMNCLWSRRFVLVAILGWSLCLLGCSYPTVSADAYELTQALHTVCDRQDASKLDRFESLLAQRVAEGKVTANEQSLLLEIAEQARRGDWDAAKQDARELMLAQNSP